MTVNDHLEKPVFDRWMEAYNLGVRHALGLRAQGNPFDELAEESAWFDQGAADAAIKEAHANA